MTLPFTMGAIAVALGVTALVYPLAGLAFVLGIRADLMLALAGVVLALRAAAPRTPPDRGRAKRKD